MTIDFFKNTKSASKTPKEIITEFFNDVNYIRRYESEPFNTLIYEFMAEKYGESKLTPKEIAALYHEQINYLSKIIPTMQYVEGTPVLVVWIEQTDGSVNGLDDEGRFWSGMWNNGKVFDARLLTS